MLDAKGLYRLEMRLSQYVGSRSFSRPQLTREEHDILKPAPKKEGFRAALAGATRNDLAGQ